MTAREHAYTGTVNDGGRGWVGYCKCGWRTAPHEWKLDAQTALSVHIHEPAPAVASSDRASVPPSPPPTPGGGASGAAGLSITTPPTCVVPDLLPPAGSGSPGRPTSFDRDLAAARAMADRMLTTSRQHAAAIEAVGYALDRALARRRAAS